MNNGSEPCTRVLARTDLNGQESVVPRSELNTMHSEYGSDGQHI